MQHFYRNIFCPRLLLFGGNPPKGGNLAEVSSRKTNTLALAALVHLLQARKEVPSAEEQQKSKDRNSRFFGDHEKTSVFDF